MFLSNLVSPKNTLLFCMETLVLSHHLLWEQELHGHDDVTLRVGVLELDRLALGDPGGIVDQAAQALAEETQLALGLDVPDLDGQIVRGWTADQKAKFLLNHGIQRVRSDARLLDRLTTYLQEEVKHVQF